MNNNDDSSGRRTAVNWREELVALRATHEAEDEEGPSSVGFEYPSASVEDDAEDEALRRFGGLSGRPRNGATAAVRSNGGSNGYGRMEYGGYVMSGSGRNESGVGSSSDPRGSRPRTRPDWRNQL